MMIRKLLFVFIFMVIATLLGRQFFRLPFEQLSLYEAIPVTVPLFVTLSEPSDAILPEQLDPTFASWMALFPGITQDFYQLDTLIKSGGVPSSKVKNGVVMVQKMDREDWGLSILLDIKNGKKGLHAILDQYKEAAIVKTQFKGETVYQITPKQGSSFSIGACRNLLIVGLLPIAVEDVIRQLSDYRSGWWYDQSFRTLVKKSDQDEASVFIQTGLFTAFFLNQMNPVSFERLKKMEDSFEWIRINLNGGGENLLLNGWLIPGEENTKLKAFAQQVSQSPDKVFRMVPDDISMFYYWGFSDFQKYYEQIQVPKIDRFERFIKPWVGAEMMQVVVDPAASATCLLIRPKDPVMAKQTLDRLLGEAGQLQAYRYNTFQVQQVMEEDLFGFLPFGPVTALRNPHITFLDEYVLFAPSRSALEIWLDQYIVGATLATDPDFLHFRENHSDPVHHLLYFNAKNWPRGKNKATLEPFLTRFPYLGLSLEEKEEMFQLKITGTAAVQPDTTGNMLWRTNLSTQVVLAPQLLPLDGMGKQVVVTQDAFYNFYVFEAGGDLLWQKKLDGPVQPPVQVIDYYSEGQFQLLFNTKKQIYCVDQRGKTMANYPLPLSSPASCGLSLVDFKQDNNPAFFVPCENEQVYGFDKKGQPLSGWNPLFDVGELSYPMLYFQKSINDYLVAQSDTSTLKVYAKDGTMQFELTDSSAVFLSPPGYDLGSPGDRIVAVDQSGTAHILNLEGAYFRLALQVGDNKQVKFAFADVVGSNSKDYIVMEGKDIAIYHYAEQGFVRALKYQFEQPQDVLFAVPFMNQQKALVGTLDKKNQKIHLLDHHGKEWPGFPITGTTPIHIVDLFGDGRPIALGANGSSVFGLALE